MKETLEIRQSSGGSRTDLIYLKGSLDAQNSARLLDRCTEIHKQRRNLVLVMNEVTFVSSSGIGALLALNEDFRRDGVSFRIASPSEAVRSAVGLLNLTTFLSIHDTQDDVLKGLAA